MPIVSGGSGGAISGVTISGAASSGQVPVASSAGAGTWKYPPGFEIGYDQITAPVTVTSSTEATGTTVISAAAHTFDGGAVMVEFFALVEPSSAAAVTVSLFESSTQITRLCESIPGAISASGYTLVGRYRFTPTAASHTYTVTAFHAAASNGTIVAGSGGTGGDPPAFIRFTKV